ncbi:MAG TPA: fluoride efflux transporter CrcB [Nitrolancea sp.]|jgi:CrcB protein|nr:fluoride efflux transporter CrcB [Nitrolancea sp.]
MNTLLVAIGGAIGAAGRYLIGGWVQSLAGTGFPAGTFFVNVTGSLIIGVILGLVERGALSSQARLLLAVGLMGGYTTFSSFSYDNLGLLQSGETGRFLLNIAGQLVIGLFAAYLGVVMARTIGGLS